jgi:hypothetical protein
MTTTVTSITDASYYISANLPATYDAAGYGATAMVYTEIGTVESVTAYGSKRAINTFLPIKGAAQKTKGTPDYGKVDITAGRISSDAGQIIMTAAEASQAHYSMMVVYADLETHYLDVLVTSNEFGAGKAGDARTVMYSCEICKAPVIVLPV